jgi:hypothetical protein
LDVYGAMTISGIAKPAWSAFKLLHTHAGDHRLPASVGPQGNTSYISAMATINSTGAGSKGGTGGTSANILPSVFLGFWGNPDPCCNASARIVHITVNQAAGASQPTKAVAHVLDDVHGNVQKLWKSLGAPNKPSPAQLATLKAASEAGVVPVPASALVKLNATATTVSLTITENSAVVVEYIV